MKFTEASSEKAFTKLLGQEGFPQRLDITITSNPDEILIEEGFFLTPDNLIRLNENLSVVNEYTEVHAFKLNFYDHYVFPEIPYHEGLEMGGLEGEVDL
ncbi:MAG: hypothetical protein WAT92_03490 [Saprospiraceae bacterium]